jgi:hypothetical protein
VEQLTQPTGSNQYFIDHEEWLNQSNYGYAGLWAEMGYSLGVNQGTTEEYFYGGESSTQYYELPLGSTGGYGNYENQSMQVNNSQGYIKYHMCTPSVCLTDQTLPYSFSPTSYTIGSELYGTAGGSSPVTTYQYEGYYSSYGGGVLWQQAQPGHDNNSPQQSWVVTPPAPGNHGGVFRGSCGC